jgi:hypothetical protein
MPPQGATQAAGLQTCSTGLLYKPGGWQRLGGGDRHEVRPSLPPGPPARCRPQPRARQATQRDCMPPPMIRVLVLVLVLRPSAPGVRLPVALPSGTAPTSAMWYVLLASQSPVCGLRGGLLGVHPCCARAMCAQAWNCVHALPLLLWLCVALCGPVWLCVAPGVRAPSPRVSRRGERTRSPTLPTTAHLPASLKTVARPRVKCLRWGSPNGRCSTPVIRPQAALGCSSRP